uniref:Gingipain domain-containing protein n=1 Tax=Ignavibacterium album TaxID=591197 RepID=A0A832DH05_9BACT
MKIKHLIFLLPFLSTINFSQNYKIIESNNNSITLQIQFDNFEIRDTIIDGKSFSYIKSEKFSLRKPGEPWLPITTLNIGIPNEANPSIIIIENKTEIIENKFILPFPENDPSIDKSFIDRFDSDIYSKNEFFPKVNAEFIDDYIFRYIRVKVLGLSPFLFNPISKKLQFSRSLTIRVEYNSPVSNFISSINDPMTIDYVQTMLINPETAQNWLSKTAITNNITQEYWYNPTLNYFKIFFREKGLYRITFEELVNSGVPISGGVETSKLTLFGQGEIVPIDVVDGGDGIFDAGDYFQFVGYPAPASPFSSLNIYNISNVYWFTYENLVDTGKYRIVDGLPRYVPQPNFFFTFDSYLEKVTYEKDKIFDRFGLANSGNRDYWNWGKATARNRAPEFSFEEYFDPLYNQRTDSPYVYLNVNLHGVTDNYWCSTHRARIFLTDQFIDQVVWNEQNEMNFSTRFYVGPDSIRIYGTGNRFQVRVYGDTCENVNDDEIRVNRFEFLYWRTLKVDSTYFNFISPPNRFGIGRFWLSGWNSSNAKIYIPSKSKLIVNPEFVNDSFNSMRFVDTVTTRTDYFVVSNDRFITVDSIRADISRSNLRDANNGADYIIITHPKFRNIAEQLKSFRETNFPDTLISNPRILIADVSDIYDEFSFGLLDPFAIKNYISYAFNNYQIPSPSYVVLIGDMSFDYRKILPNSRENYIPSINYWSYPYGVAASDNMFVAVSGSDVVPDLAIGRISIEEVSEGQVVLNKIINYPADNGKEWKQKVLLFASGLSESDEQNFGFNDASLLLEDDYISPKGLATSKVFRYPTKQRHYPFVGGTAELRSAINQGGVLANYYGHGGGYQWDFMFLNDDIYELQNENRLPFILSVTCYTAHFDNQDVFGEQFIKVPNKGCIGFFGSAGLTYWGVGKTINEKIFDQIFNQKNFVIGKALLKAKQNVPSVGFYESQIALQTLLGEPLTKLAIPEYPDFSIKSNNISLSKENPLVNDSIEVKIILGNLGSKFRSDSVVVELFATSSDTSYQIGSTKILTFSLIDSVSFPWIPDRSGLYNLRAEINLKDQIQEMDYSDNSASNSFPIYNIGEPNIIKPYDGFATSESVVKFYLADISELTGIDIKYEIEIDTNNSFTNPIQSSGLIRPNNDGLLIWSSNQLPNGYYFWRVRTFAEQNYSPWSKPRKFSVINNSQNGYYLSGKHLLNVENYNLLTNQTGNGVVLNTELLPPRPANNTFIENFIINPSLPDSIKLNTITTDGTYLYIATNWFFAIPNNPYKYSRIYKIGTGNNGTVKGFFYGPFSEFFGKIDLQIFYHSDGYIYVATGNPYYLTRINTQTEQIDSVFIPDGLLERETARVDSGSFYLNSDGIYIYNITIKDSLGSNKYVVRKFDPSNNWNKVGNDIALSGSSYSALSAFFVYEDYIYLMESFEANFIRKNRLTDGSFVEEWLLFTPMQGFYSMCYDWQNNLIFAGTYRAGFPTKFSKFIGSYTDANGFLSTDLVGPAKKWNSLNIDIDNPSPSANYKIDLYGLNNLTRLIDTLYQNISANFDLTNINASDYPFLKAKISLSDSSFGTVDQIAINSINFNYNGLPELFISKSDIIVEPDSILQGLNTNLKFSIKNAGLSDADSISVLVYLNNSDSTFSSFSFPILSDSSKSVVYPFNTSTIILDNSFRLVIEPNEKEFFSFNNQIEKPFFVSRDSISPRFQITFDGREILDGDIISSEPVVMITLEDNSPLPLDTTLFTIVHNNIPMRFSNPDLSFSYTPYPNSKAEVLWTPKLKDGRHVLEVLAKDASNNFFDTTSYRQIFYVYNDPDLRQVYNYPNPFKDDTYFTFELRGVNPPEEFKIKVFTIAGRLIREIIVPPSSLQIGFNKIYWDGKDQDGDEIANGLYFYKIISKQGDEIKTVTQKLAKVK